MMPLSHLKPPFCPTLRFVAHGLDKKVIPREFEILTFVNSIDIKLVADRFNMMRLIDFS